MAVYKSVTELIGRTPLLELSHYGQMNDIHGKILAKVEGMNPAGSIKDRAALYMILDAEKKGKLERCHLMEKEKSREKGIR